MRDKREADSFQEFCIAMLSHLGYDEVVASTSTDDMGCDGTCRRKKDGARCFVAVSFDASLSKIQKDADRWRSARMAPNAQVMVFMTWRTNRDRKITSKTIQGWEEKIQQEYGIELEVYHQQALLNVARNETVWPETRALLGLRDEEAEAPRPGFTCVSPYDSDTVRGLMNVRPREILEDPLPRRELQGRKWDRNCLVLGKPGAGKTTAIFMALEGLRPERTFLVERAFGDHAQAERLADQLEEHGGVLVFDDIWEQLDGFKTLCQVLLARQLENVLLLTASRTADWDAITQKGEFPTTYLEELGLIGDAVLRLGDLQREECRRLVERCRDQWGLQMEERFVRIAAETAAEGDASPLYVISILAPARGRDDHRVLDVDVAGVPGNVCDVWAGYFDKLPAEHRTVLKLVKLFSGAHTEPQRHLLDLAAHHHGLSPYQVSDALDHLRRVLWIGERHGAPWCLDVQLEAIGVSSGDYEFWDTFISEAVLPTPTLLSLLNGTGGYYYQTRRPRAKAEAEYRQATEASLRHFEQALRLSEDQADRAMCLNNASGLQAELAAQEPTREARRERLEKAVASVEESIGLYRQLGLAADVAMSLNNASRCYSDLAELETELEARRSLLEKALACDREAIDLFRQLGLQGNLATTLNSASVDEGYLAALETTREARRERLEKAIGYIEESIGLRRQLGLAADLASSLNNASLRYGDLAALETTRQARRKRLEKAVATIEESIGIRRQLGLAANLAMSLNNASGFYGELAALETTREARRERLEKAIGYIEESIGLRRQLGLAADLASSLNNASGCYSDLAALETTREARRDRLEKAVAYIEEAIGLCRQLGLAAELATSLNNASGFYGELAVLQTTREGQRERLEKGVATIEEAIGLRRRLGLAANLATSLSNASNRHSELAALETTREARRERLEKAVAFIEESIGIRRQLGLAADLAASLNNASGRYSDLAALETTREARRDRLEKAVASIEEAIGLYRRLGLAANLAASLNNAAESYTGLADMETEREARVAQRQGAAAAAREANELFRAVGHTEHFLGSLRNRIMCSLRLAAEKHEREDPELAALCAEGERVAREYGDADLAEWFAATKRRVDTGISPE